MLFDIELRVRTNGKRSLDDIELALWNYARTISPALTKMRFGGN